MIRVASSSLSISLRRWGGRCAVAARTSGVYSSTASSSTPRCFYCATSSRAQDDIETSASPSIHLLEPALALAYDYVDFDDDGDMPNAYRDDEVSPSPSHDTSHRDRMVQNHLHMLMNANNGGSRSTTSSPYPPPSSHYDPGKVIPRGKSGGGGGGRHRCPKCGTFVTFRHGDFEDNTFYCAACSGWFLANPAHRIVSSSDNNNSDNNNKYDDAILEKRESPQVLMQHIPNTTASAADTKIYPSSRQQQQQQQASNTFGEAAEEFASRKVPPQKQQHNLKRMPTPKEIMKGLNEYVIGQKSVKVALSVGVYNHYKRIFVAEAQAAAEQRKAAEEGFAMPPPPQQQHQQHMGNNDGPSLADMNLGQFGSSSSSSAAAAQGVSQKQPEEATFDSTTTNKSQKLFCETPDINSINDSNFGREVEDCEIDKSNIMLLGKCFLFLLSIRVVWLGVGVFLIRSLFQFRFYPAQ